MKIALLVIDVQQGIFAGREALPDWPQRFKRIQALIQRARGAEVPVIYVQHDGGAGHRLEPGSPGWSLDARLDVRPADPVIRKTAPDSFFETALQAALQAHNIDALAICGCWTNYCVDTTCRRAVSLGYKVQLAGDAHACCDSSALTGQQIIAHHNDILDGLSAGRASLAVKPAAEIVFS
jgi:nicotinamidase-related amidase